MSISIIIPIHEYNEKTGSYLNKAIESIEKQEDCTILPKVILIYPSSIEESIKTHTSTILQIVYQVNGGKTDYQSQVNTAVGGIDTDYFTVLEFDDELGKTYMKNANKYIETYPNTDIFLTMLIEVNEKDEGIKLTNEIVWAQQFVGENGEAGYLNTTALKQYTDFKLSGAIIKKSEFVANGKYKTNIKLTFMYEYLLRALNNANKIFSIPKIGYKHLATREGSLFDNYQKTMPANERKFWFDVAVKESNFSTDRDIDTTKLQKIVVAEK